MVEGFKLDDITDAFDGRTDYLFSVLISNNIIVFSSLSNKYKITIKKFNEIIAQI